MSLENPKLMASRDCWASAKLKEGLLKPRYLVEVSKGYDWLELVLENNPAVLFRA